ncbi:nucleotidyl transferase AbiEii/AbiGii toxin family protein [Enterococcus sp.]|uniref:nucleotidyl transferase AbiEii/AbiGii toxin family protein n=1 Tax=Enterococcus sp. TaxID=35783 RepID=UPI00291504EE|nr:nucleotidyl transferase AbiEii/AbiGii toxin family protein [Enterococcus sp.]MDU5333059.1 nucleotidyl transferase AbiEii/AbiGii toxin family protein [Enterococcus sp.]
MPINSNEKFLAAFKEFKEHYVLIGGTATSLILAQYDLKSRTTKDYDLVIIDDKKDKAFYKALVRFFQEGSYAPTVMDKERKLYRFTTTDSDYPAVIELFCVIPDWFRSELRTAPVHFDEEMSLSALLLDKDYYHLLEQGKSVIDGYSVLDNKHLIIFKAKAWLDLSEKKEAGTTRVDSRNIKKHLNDIARLTGSLTDTNKIPLNDKVQEDMRAFLDRLEKNRDAIPQNDDIVLEPLVIFQALKDLLY